jgi:succinyl-diaminopimelate desuccinylase
VRTGNGATNVIPGTATIQLNIRFNNLQRGEDLVELVRRTAEEAAPGSTVEAKISGEPSSPPPARSTTSSARRSAPRPA